LISNAPYNDQEEDFYYKNVPQARFFTKQNAPQARLENQNALQANFFE